jgi:hypothetical protein
MISPLLWYFDYQLVLRKPWVTIHQGEEQQEQQSGYKIVFFRFSISSKVNSEFCLATTWWLRSTTSNFLVSIAVAGQHRIVILVGSHKLSSIWQEKKSDFLKCHFEASQLVKAILDIFADIKHFNVCLLLVQGVWSIFEQVCLNITFYVIAQFSIIQFCPNIGILSENFRKKSVKCP